MKPLTEKQLAALSLYADGYLRNEQASKIHPATYRILEVRGLVVRAQFLLSVITDAGRAELAKCKR